MVALKSLRPYITTGIALTGAGLVAVVPARTPLPELSQHADSVKLTSGESDLFGAYTDLSDHTAENISALGDSGPVDLSNIGDDWANLGDSVLNVAPDIAFDTSSGMPVDITGEIGPLAALGLAVVGPFVNVLAELNDLSHELAASDDFMENAATIIGAPGSLLDAFLNGQETMELDDLGEVPLFNGLLVPAQDFDPDYDADTLLDTFDFEHNLAGLADQLGLADKPLSELFDTLELNDTSLGDLVDSAGFGDNDINTLVDNLGMGDTKFGDLIDALGLGDQDLSEFGGSLDFDYITINGSSLNDATVGELISATDLGEQNLGDVIGDLDFGDTKVGDLLGDLGIGNQDLGDVINTLDIGDTDVTDALENLGLEDTDLSDLMDVGDIGNTELGDLAESLGIDGSTLGGILDKTDLGDTNFADALDHLGSRTSPSTS